MIHLSCNCSISTSNMIVHLFLLLLAVSLPSTSKSSKINVMYSDSYLLCRYSHSFSDKVKNNTRQDHLITCTQEHSAGCPSLKEYTARARARGRAVLKYNADCLSSFNYCHCVKLLYPWLHAVDIDGCLITYNDSDAGSTVL